MGPVRSLRVRYVIGLGAMAVLLLCIYWLMQDSIQRQENNGHVIHVAGNQIGLANRISFFASELTRDLSEDDFETARKQIRIAINQMRSDHNKLVHGTTASGFPVIRTELLDLIYNDPSTGLERAVHRFLGHAEVVANAPQGSPDENDASLLYVTTYGPYVLDSLLGSAVTEYEAFAKQQIEWLQDLETFAVAAALVLLLVEAVFVFKPLEKIVRDSLQALRVSRDEMRDERQAAETANRAKSNFLSNMSHELRTPLNAIIVFSESINHGVYGPIVSPKLKDAVESIRLSGTHLLRLVSDILDISAAEAGSIALDESRFSVADNGIGMTPLEILIARERFGQAENIETRTHEGSGLGIPVAIELMKRRGGTLDIESQKDVGTTFTALFPPERIEVVPLGPDADGPAAAPPPTIRDQSPGNTDRRAGAPTL